MKYTKSFLVGALVCLAGTGEAQISRVFVSTTGNDGNDCLQPISACRTLLGAITKVDAHGEVIITETGSYSGGTITKSVKIDAPPGVVAFSATGIIVNPPSDSDVVVIRGLTLKAIANLTGVAIDLKKGNLFVENSVLDGWSFGLIVEGTTASSRVFLTNSLFRNNGTGLLSAALTAAVAVEGSSFENNSIGVQVDGGHVALSRSVVSGSVLGLRSSSSGGFSLVTLQFCQLTHNGVGLKTQYGGIARVSDSTIAGNTTFGLYNLAEAGGGTLERFGTNLMSGNGANFGGAVTLGTLQ